MIYRPAHYGFASFKFQVSGFKFQPTPNPQSPTPTLVGRETELVQLHTWLEKVLNGQRQIVFVSGEAGIGKTTVVEAFLQTLDSRPQTLDARLWIGRGQCIEHYGAGEAYMPMLEALGRLCRESGGEREEMAYGDQAREIAAELAVHFERGRDYCKTVQYLQQAGENALRRSAHREAISLLTQGLELLKTLPDAPERAQQELTLQIALGVPLMATKGYAAPEVGQAYARARELYQGGRGNATALPCPVGPMGILHQPGRVTDGSGAGGAAARPSPEHTGPGSPRRGSLCAGSDLVLSRRVYPSTRALGAGGCPLRPSATPLSRFSLQLQS